MASGQEKGENHLRSALAPRHGDPEARRPASQVFRAEQGKARRWHEGLGADEVLSSYKSCFLELFRVLMLFLVPEMPLNPNCYKYID